MKRFYLILAIFFGVALPAAGFPSSLIELKSGAKFVTSYTWEEGDLIKFYIYGGTVGFEKRGVKKIERTDLPNTGMEPQAVSEPQKPISEKETTPAVKEAATPSKKKASLSSSKKARLLKRQKRIQTRVTAATEALKKARSGKSRRKIRTARKRLLRQKKKLQKIQNQLKQEETP